MSRFMVVDDALKRGQRARERMEMFLVSAHRLWSLGLVYLQTLHHWSRSALISADPCNSSY